MASPPHLSMAGGAASIHHSRLSFLCFSSSLSLASCSSQYPRLQIAEVRRRRVRIVASGGRLNRSPNKHSVGEFGGGELKTLVLEDEGRIGDVVASWAVLGQLRSGIFQTELLTYGGDEGVCHEEKLGIAVLGDGFDGGCQGSSLACSFGTGVKSTALPLQQQGGSDKRKYYLNTGYALRTLREELPTMFYKEMTYEIYREDIVFRDPMNIFGGVDNYKCIFWALRFHGQIFFKALWVDILRIWQPCEDAIMVRWQVHGVPRVPWEAQGIFDGISEYKLDKDGKIYEHRVDNVALNSWKKFKALTVADLVGVVSCPSIPKPTFFGRTELMFHSLLLYLLQFTWVRYYLALKGTVDLRTVKWPGYAQ